MTKVFILVFDPNPREGTETISVFLGTLEVRLHAEVFDPNPREGTETLWGPVP